MVAPVVEFREAFERLDPGDALFVVGGTFPGPDDRAHIDLDLDFFVPGVKIVTGIENGDIRRNPAVATGAGRVTVEMERGGKRFGSETDDDGTHVYGKRAARIGDTVVDVWIAHPWTNRERYYVMKP